MRSTPPVSHSVQATGPTSPPWRIAGKDRLARGVLHARIDLLQRRDLRRGQAFVRFARFAQEAQGRRDSPGSSRMPFSPWQALSVASVTTESFSGESQLSGVSERVSSVQTPLVSVGREIRRRAGDDPVIVFWKPLSFHKRMLATRRDTGCADPTKTFG